MILRISVAAAVLCAVIGYGSSASAQIIPKSDVYAVDSAATSINGGAFGSYYAHCNDGTDQVLSGGCWTYAYSQKAVVTQQYPLPYGTGAIDEYFCEWYNIGTSLVYVHTRIECVSQ